MKKIYTYLWLCLCGMAVAACGEDEDTTPSMADEDRLETLIDTSNEDIVNFKNAYGTYILYEFDDLLDFAYQFEEASAWRSAVVTKLDQSDVAGAVSFLMGGTDESTGAFIDCYSDDVLVTYFPRKLLICESIASTSDLGISTPSSGVHTAVANINSMTIAKLDAASIAALDEESRTAYFRQLHYIFLAGYVVGAREYYFTDDTFFDYSESYYLSLIDENRVQAQNYSKETNLEGFYEKFYNRGFFYSDSDEDTYYRSAQDDLMSFIENLVFMDQDLCDEILTGNDGEAFSLMYAKMKLTAEGLQAMGVDVAKINAIAAENFLDD